VLPGLRAELFDDVVGDRLPGGVFPFDGKYDLVHECPCALAELPPGFGVVVLHETPLPPTHIV
jgi:hypothetical protein